MNKEEQAIDETTDTDMTDDLSVEEHNNDTETADSDSLTDDLQTTSEPDETVPTEQAPEKPEPDAEYISVLASVEQHLLKLEELFTGQIARNQNQKQMFDAIYREMKDYKENALLETIHKPIIHNLIRLYDDFRAVESQLNSINEKKELLQFRTNLENVRFELEEVLYRMDVTPYEEHPKKLDRKLHKTVDTRQTDEPDKDREVAEIHKIGFYWGEKVFRPEEVTIYRYTPPPVETEETVSENLTNEEGDETDG